MNMYVVSVYGIGGVCVCDTYTVINSGSHLLAFLP